MGGYEYIRSLLTDRLFLQLMYEHLLHVFPDLFIVSSLLSACGRSMVNSYNAGVRNATPGSWPWQAALSANGSVFCGGSLITDEWVLTAAYCTARMNINDTMVRLGLQTVSGVNPNEVSRGIVANVCFPAYDPETYDNDICLLKLSAPVNFTDYIRPVCLAAANSTFYSGTSFITGFGSTDNFGSNPNVLQQVNIPRFGRRQCECEQPNVTRNMICAGGQASCRGDYGGPLVNSNGPNSSWIQSGILSGDYDCATPRGPGVYTLVSRYQQWIEATVTGMPPGFITFTSRGNDSDLNFTCPTPLQYKQTTDEAETAED
uniref:Chymotrypsin-like protease CTRL-1 n=1 Tax=Stegastes partitus TaxID=144197 RepID=A0A3B5AZP8_9TELE